MEKIDHGLCSFILSIILFLTIALLYFDFVPTNLLKPGNYTFIRYFITLYLILLITSFVIGVVGFISDDEKNNIFSSIGIILSLSILLIISFLVYYSFTTIPTSETRPDDIIEKQVKIQMKDSLKSNNDTISIYPTKEITDNKTELIIGIQNTLKQKSHFRISSSERVEITPKECLTIKSNKLTIKKYNVTVKSIKNTSLTITTKQYQNKKCTQELSNYNTKNISIKN